MAEEQANSNKTTDGHMHIMSLYTRRRKNQIEGLERASREGLGPMVGLRRHNHHQWVCYVCKVVAGRRNAA